MAQLSALALLLVAACSPADELERLDGIAMTMGYSILIGDSNPDMDQVESVVLSTFSEINAVFNNWNPESEISQLNKLPAGEKKPLSQPLAHFLRRINELVILTEGRFDPTIAPIKESLLKGELYPDSHAIGWDKIHIDGDLFWKEHNHTALDLGGAAKGHGVDLLFENLQEAGFKNIFVEWGGEIRASGSHPEKRPWKIAIRGSETLELKERAIATSGSYLQKWTIDETSYTHIIDPKTKKPLSSPPITSASVLCESCFEADALATALMLFASQEEAEMWAKAHNLKVWLF